MAGSDAPSAEDVWQLWSLACVLAQRQLTTQLAQCLEPLCAVDYSSRSAGEQEILAQANVMLAEICVVACSNGKQADNLDLWTRRVIQTEKSIYAVDAAIARGVFCSHVSKLRLLKAKFLLQQQLKAERTAKNRRMLEILCEGLRTCAETEGENAEVIAEFREYFGVKLKACLVKMHAATVKAKHVQDNSGINSFAENLKYLRTTLPDYIDNSFLLWLVEVTCQTAISSFQPGSTAEMHQLVDFGQEFFDKVSVEQSVSPEFRLHHLIISGFYYLRTGKSGKVMPLLEEINLLVQGTWNDSDQKPVRVVRETYLDTIRDLMRVNVVACSDPKEALDLAMKAILAAQGNLQIYAQYPAVQLMLIATLFDLLYVYCRLLGLQCRYADMGDSLVQMTTLFATHKIKQIYPSRVLLQWVTRVLTMDGLRHHIYKCCSAELRAKNAELEELRPKSFTLLHEALQRINASGSCCETTSEIMVLLGPQLASFGKSEQGEEMLRNAIRSTLHSKNVLLQMRLLANIFDLYSSKRLAQAQATAAAKYNKKLGVLQRRIAAAQAEADTTAALMEWSAGNSSTKASTPSRG
uniref:Uncharacterized protein n=1 Tax=Phytophthora ramorum TaxID=164328 RepID=H3HEA6_PHYRM